MKIIRGIRTNCLIVSFLFLCSINSFVAASQCQVLPVKHSRKSQSPLNRTTQQVPSTCFSHFNNLYFDSATQTFFTIGNKTKIVNPDTRGYKWAQYNSSHTIQEKPFTIQGKTIFVFERNATPNFYLHYFHFLEHLLGIWNFGGEENREDVGLFVLAGNGRASAENGQRVNDLVFHLIKAVFPHAEIKCWDEFIEQSQGKTLCFDMAISSDRSMEIFKKEPYNTERMLGGYFQSLTKESLDRLASHVWNYCHTEPVSSDKIRVTYIKRCESRQLSPDTERELIERISNLPHINLKVVDFARIPFIEQIQIAANTDVLLGVHGNGLSHALFLPTGATLIELFPENSFRTEYRIFAKARGLKYFGWVDQMGWISDATAEGKGCFGNVYINNLNTNIDAIIEILQ